MIERLLCVEITLHAPDPGVEEAIEDAFWTQPIAGVERQDDETWSALVEDPRPRIPGTVRWRIHVADADDEAAVIEGFRSCIPSDEEVTIEAWQLDDLSFLTRWKDHFRPAQISPRIVVHPPWEIPSVDDGVVRVEIEPGMAFGTGTHETTRLCLRALDAHLSATPAVARVLDVGCGSGVLAIACAKLGVAEVLGIDHDADAVRIANENVAINGVSDQVTCTTTPIHDVSMMYPVVVANILPHILESIAPAIWDTVAPGGLLLLSGILHEEADRMRDAFARPFATWEGQLDDGEWCAQQWRRGDGGA